MSMETIWNTTAMHRFGLLAICLIGSSQPSALSGEPNHSGRKSSNLKTTTSIYQRRRTNHRLRTESLIYSLTGAVHFIIMVTGSGVIA